ncbi:hypothetical protein GCM10007304_17440 [Rhodococcoides trifolii]|uniref:Recombinase domain-containing protein n=1 Tax=Rhodococcoides trifolii TaxID=908250 RepID=A0A917FSB6_9NOCA|nr:recombinase family protein [Rhodococcus trifolii]GGG03831.1 hypothetical protein GCM10007304_17440 [Rhodococcus trifolii]
MSRPYGYADNRTDIVEQEAAVIRRMAEHLTTGGHLRALATQLNDEHIPTASNSSWHPITIKRALTNPRIIGMADQDGELVPSATKPILDRDTYDKLVALFTDPARSKFTRTNGRVHLLSGGIARCGMCGSQLYANVSGDRPDQYRCSKRAQGGCGRIGIKAADLEAEVVERVLARLSDAVMRRELTKAMNELHAPNAAEKELGELESRLVALGEDYADGIIERATLKASTERIRQRIENVKLQAARREVLTDIPEPSAEQVVQWWEQASKRRQRDVVAALLDHVTVMPSQKRPLRGLNPDRLRWEWKSA